MNPDESPAVAFRWILPALFLVALACGSGATPQSETPRITTETGGSHASALLTEDDVRSIAGLEGVSAAEISDVPVFENPATPPGATQR